jgi:glycosyltransferase involved in cell wall biosynthesis/2-polyprenyl-3-methyl-5-hydroxy-6-metoxy-1,4-benzoquinol methylase
MTGLYWAFLVDSVPFTRAVVDGATSLGGSESACLGLARALVARGHHVHIYAAKLAEDAAGQDAAGVWWRPIEHFATDNPAMTWDVVVALRMSHWFGPGVQARLRILWNEDLLTPAYAPAVMSVAWALDVAAYVSAYHRAQWEDLQPELAPIGWVTKNGYDPTVVPDGVVKDPNLVVHVSRPERGLGPLLQMWPAVRAANPQARLALCRYQSMYDGEGTAARTICDAFDADVAAVQAEVGGIEWLGSLTKPDLMALVAKAAVMWYPGVSYFAETSCIAAIEAQACGTPFVGSLKGALPETAAPAYEAGLLIPGVAETDAAYQRASVAAVLDLMAGCARGSFAYRKLVQAGRSHVRGYTVDAVAAEWETFVAETFRRRYEANQIGVLRQLMHEEDRVAAAVVADEILAPHRFTIGDLEGIANATDPTIGEARDAAKLCDRIIHGLEEGPAEYTQFSMDPLVEIQMSTRLADAAKTFAEAGATRVLDIACGNGAGAIAIAQANPAVRVVGIDYAAGNIAKARAAAAAAGVADRCRFHVGTVYDFETQRTRDLWEILDTAVDENDGQDLRFDGLFVGEFLEHVAECSELVAALEAYLREGATVVYTCPAGPFRDLAVPGKDPRTHVHCFAHDDLDRIFGAKTDYASAYMQIDTGVSRRGAFLGHWIIRYRYEAGRPTGTRDLPGRIVRTRPKPTVSLGLITLNAGVDLRRCLDSVAPIVDEIIVGDTGSTDDTKAIAAAYGARVLDLAPIAAQAEGFAGARNAVLAAATGDWFFWIDADEVLLGGLWVRRYLEGPVFNGIVLHQQHLYLDRAPTYDIPVRIFRRLPAIRFYGVVHEQPQMGDANGMVLPSLEIEADPDRRGTLVVHFGYLSETQRRTKAVARNLPLVRRDQEVFPDRRLGKVFVVRDYVNLAIWELERSDGQMTARAENAFLQAARIFIETFDDPADLFHEAVRPFYESALRHLGWGREYEWAEAGRDGGMGDAHARLRRVWVRDWAEYKRYRTYQTEAAERRELLEQRPAKTDPFVLPARVAA